MAVRTNFKAVLERIKGDIKNTVTPEQMRILGDEAVRLITVRTRLGYGVARSGGERHKLKALSEGYIESRRKSKGKLSGFTSPGRSNLTYSGQLLDSLAVIVKRFGFFIEPSGARDDGISQQDIAETVSRARPFLAMSALEIKQLKRFYENKILGKVLRRRGLTR